MIDQATLTATTERTGRPPWATVGAGLAGGLTLGVAARAWMRLISDDPEFTWNGTIFIIASFTFFGLMQGIGTALQRARHRWVRTTGRAAATIGLLPLFQGPGVLMLPTVVGAGLATSRPTWRRPARVIAVIIAALPVLLLSNGIRGSFGWSLHTAAGVATMIAVYAAVVRGARTAFVRPAEPRRVPRWLPIAAAALVALVFLGLVAGFALR